MMHNQKIQYLDLNQFKSILSLYLFTIGTSLMGFSLYLVIEVFRYDSNNITSWSGQSLFWSLILFFSSLFILFFPIELLHTYKLINNSFTELIANILFTIIVSLFFLVTFQVLIQLLMKYF